MNNRRSSPIKAIHFEKSIPPLLIRSIIEITAAKSGKCSTSKKRDDNLCKLAWEGKFEELESFLKEGADPNVTNIANFTPLHCACEFGKFHCVALLLDYGAQIEDANPVDGRTALHWAAFNGHSEVVELLLKRGANPLSRNNTGQLPGDSYSKDASSRRVKLISEMLRKARRLHGCQDKSAPRRTRSATSSPHRSAFKKNESNRVEVTRGGGGLLTKDDYASAPYGLPKLSSSHKEPIMYRGRNSSCSELSKEEMEKLWKSYTPNQIHSPATTTVPAKACDVKKTGRNLAIEGMDDVLTAYTPALLMSPITDPGNNSGRKKLSQKFASEDMDNLLNSYTPTAMRAPYSEPGKRRSGKKAVHNLAFDDIDNLVNVYSPTAMLSPASACISSTTNKSFTTDVLFEDIDARWNTYSPRRTLSLNSVSERKKPLGQVESKSSGLDAQDYHANCYRAESPCKPQRNARQPTFTFEGEDKLEDDKVIRTEASPLKEHRRASQPDFTAEDQDKHAAAYSQIYPTGGCNFSILQKRTVSQHARKRSMSDSAKDFSVLMTQYKQGLAVIQNKNAQLSKELDDLGREYQGSNAFNVQTDLNKDLSKSQTVILGAVWSKKDQPHCIQKGLSVSETSPVPSESDGSRPTQQDSEDYTFPEDSS